MESERLADSDIFLSYVFVRRVVPYFLYTWYVVRDPVFLGLSLPVLSAVPWSLETGSGGERPCEARGARDPEGERVDI